MERRQNTGKCFLRMWFSYISSVFNVGASGKRNTVRQWHEGLIYAFQQLSFWQHLFDRLTYSCTHLWHYLCVTVGFSSLKYPVNIESLRRKKEVSCNISKWIENLLVFFLDSYGAYFHMEYSMLGNLTWSLIRSMNTDLIKTNLELLLV